MGGSPESRKLLQSHTTTYTTTSHYHNQKDKRRPWRILAFAFFFVATSMRRLHITTSSYETYFTSLSDVSGSQSSSSNTRYASARDADLIIFYNLYIPQDEEGIVNAINVIKDQIGQIAKVLTRMENEVTHSSLKKKKQQRNKEKRGVVLYNLIGNENAFSTDQMSTLCHTLHPRLDCNLLQYHTEASEAVTLQDVHDFCHSDIAHEAEQQTHNNSTLRVVYLHSKGSYHSQDTNHIWRRQMTDASLHPDCLSPPNNDCDVCSAQFYIKYAIMFPGNMWTAKCSYIRRLISPLTNGEYTKRKEASIKQFLLLRLWGVLHATLDTDNVEHYGLDRYQWEHWITHPSIQPCELHTTNVTPLILLGKDPKGRTISDTTKSEYYDWGMAPRRIKANLGGLRNARIRLENNPDAQFTEYYYMAGNLLKWFALYKEDGIPHHDSWIWNSFLGADRWKELVMKHGTKAIDVMVEESKPRFHSAFELNHTKTMNNRAVSSVQMFGESPTGSVTVVFYQISFPPVSNLIGLRSVQAQFDVLYMGQYDNVTNMYDTKSSRILLYYTISGGSKHEIDSVSKLCKEKSDRIICRQLGKYDIESTTGEILHYMYTYCNDKPSSFNVIHITNRIPGHISYKVIEKSYDASRIQAITTAVVSKLCHLHTATTNDEKEETCNVCGQEFYPLPFLHFTGNMYSTTCGYINKLLPPTTFEKQMNEVAQDALLAQLEEVYTTKLIRFNERILGSYQHSTEHWIGSHPDLKPCDVAPRDINIIENGNVNSMSRYSLGQAPRRSSAPLGTFNSEGDAEAELKFRLKRDVALREYYYLAGNNFRWHRLYDTMPSDNSWVWKHFPDGQLWLAASRSGDDAINHLLNHASSEREAW